MQWIRQIASRLTQSRLARERAKPRATRRPPVTLEAMEPRVLLSAEVINLGLGDDTLSLTQTGINEVSYSWGGGSGTLTGFTSLTINGLGGSDVINLDFNGANFGASLSILGGDGNDLLLLTGSLLLTGNDLTADAENIQSDATIAGAGSVELTAIGETSAAVAVMKSITASGDVVLSASVERAATLGDYVSLTGPNASSGVSVQGDSTVIQGASVAVSAYTKIDIDASINSGGLIGLLPIAQSNTTTASVTGGATLRATGPGAAGQVGVSATDES
jgi:hypothetical protein